MYRAEPDIRPMAEHATGPMVETRRSRAARRLRPGPRCARMAAWNYEVWYGGSYPEAISGR